MSAQRGVDDLRRELGANAALPDLSSVSEPAMQEFVNCLRKAKRDQKALLANSAEHSLRLVPALLRPVVRKVLFG